MLRDIAAATASKPARSLVETARMPSHTPKWPPVLCPRPARLVRRVRQAHLSVISRLARSSHACMLWRDETATLRPVEARRPASNRWGEMLSRRIHESQIRRRRAEPPTIRDWTLALQLSSRDCCAASQCVPMCRTRRRGHRGYGRLGVCEGRGGFGSIGARTETAAAVGPALARPWRRSRSSGHEFLGNCQTNVRHACSLTKVAL
ncbi:hypothetical protein PCL_02055 [Purpureocillium lilacinum]|uniref:Uncharacterized protein n=1 Tax=Purpureocillium lilacinum TaxID=33203 RepID=A0A2U3E1C7_PURLI|nr:hypothetical protein PCL_02055 [Purpureocillium lilacinum]